MLTKAKSPKTANKAGLISSVGLIDDFRMHISDILSSRFGVLDHTRETLTLMRSAYSADDPEQAQIDSIERKIQHTHMHRPRLHAQILASAISVVRIANARTVVDIGCGEGLLVRALSLEKPLKRIVGTDIDPRQIKAARAIVEGAKVPKSASVKFCLPEELTKNDLNDVDVATVLEVVEHVDDKNWIDNVFAFRPRHIVVTTPNRDFNSLYKSSELCTNGLRHADHAFEFTQQEFKNWSKSLSKKHGYSVDLLPIGPSTIEHGSSVMMAVFTRIDSKC